FYHPGLPRCPFLGHVRRPLPHCRRRSRRRSRRGPQPEVPAIPKLSWTCRVQFFRFATLVSPLSFWLGRQNSDAEFSANRDPHLARRGVDREPPVAIASARGCSRVSTSDQQSLPMQYLRNITAAGAAEDQ